MNKQLMNEQIQNELAEYRNLTTDEEKAAFWEHILVLDPQLTKEDRSLINEVIYDDLQRMIIKTKDLLRRDKLVRTTS